MNYLTTTINGETLSTASRIQFTIDFDVSNTCFICKCQFPKPTKLCFIHKLECGQERLTHATYIGHPCANIPSEITSNSPVSLRKSCSSGLHQQFDCECICSDMSLEEFLHLHPFFFRDMVDEINEGSRATYNRPCRGCYNKLIEQSLTQANSFTLDEWGDVQLKCPVCKTGFVSSYAHIDKQTLALFCKTIDKERKRQREIVFYCPVTGCQHKEFGSVPFTNCLQHNRHCIKCWKQINDNKLHECLTIPKELLDYDEKQFLVRCPHCSMLYQKDEEGCDHLQCKRCQNKFDESH